MKYFIYLILILFSFSCSDINITELTNADSTEISWKNKKYKDLNHGWRYISRDSLNEKN